MVVYATYSNGLLVFKSTIERPKEKLSVKISFLPVLRVIEVELNAQKNDNLGTWLASLNPKSKYVIVL